MKRITAMLSALSISLAILTGCGNGISKNTFLSDSKTETDSKEVTAEPIEDTDMAAAYTSLVKGRDFKVTMTISSDVMEDTTTTFEICGGDYRMSMGTENELTELFIIGGVMYVLDRREMIYIRNESPEEIYLNVDTQSYSMSVGDDYEYVGSEKTSDGLICETYHAPALLSGVITDSASEGEKTVYKYYFEQDGTIPVKVDMSAYGISQTTILSDLSFDVEPIGLPDLSDWTDATESYLAGAE